MSEGREVRPLNTFDRMEAAARAGAGIVLDEADVQLPY